VAVEVSAAIVAVAAAIAKKVVLIVGAFNLVSGQSGNPITGLYA
jgi:hypothetical protein